MTVRASAIAVVAGRVDGGEVVAARMASIHSVVSTSRAVRSHSGCGTRKLGSSRVFSASSDMAAASSRRSISMATDRASVSTTSCGRSRLASGTKRSNMAGGEAHGLEIARELLAHAGPHHLDGDGAPRRRGRAMRALWTWAIEAAATGSLKSREQLVDRSAEGDLDHARRLVAREGRHAVLQAFEIARRGDADDVGARRQELPELDVGRPEPRQRRRQPRGAGAGARPLDRAGDAQQQARRRRQDARIDQRQRALARQHEAGAEVAREMDDAADHVRSSSPNGWRRCRPSWRGASRARSLPPRSCARRRRGGGKRRIDSTR